MATYAKVMPLGDWGEDGFAEVWIYGILNIHDILPIEFRTTTPDNTTICRTDPKYPKGVVRINIDDMPQPPKDGVIILPTDLPTGECITFQDWPHGVIWFM